MDGFERNICQLLPSCARKWSCSVQKLKSYKYSINLNSMSWHSVIISPILWLLAYTKLGVHLQHVYQDHRRGAASTLPGGFQRRVRRVQRPAHPNRYHHSHVCSARIQDQEHVTRDERTQGASPSKTGLPVLKSFLLRYLHDVLLLIGNGRSDFREIQQVSKGKKPYLLGFVTYLSLFSALLKQMAYFHA